MERLYMDNAAESWPKAPGIELSLARAACAPPGSRAAQASECRELLAGLLGLRDGSRIALTQNATMALNMCLMGFPYKKGDVALATVAEHNSVLRPLYALKKRGVIRDFITVPVDPDGRVELEGLERALRNSQAGIFVFAHADPVTGALNDAAALARLCRSYGAATLLDASQTAGVFPLTPEEWGIDMLAGSGHKYLLGPKGTGFLYASGRMELRPFVLGSTPSHADRWTMPDEFPWNLEAGSLNELGFSALAHSLRWSAENPSDMSAMEENTRLLERGLKEAGASPIYVGGQRMPVVAFTSHIAPSQMGETLKESYDVSCSMGLHQSPLLLPWLGFDERGSVRLSLSRFTSRGEVSALIEAVGEILRE